MYVVQDPVEHVIYPLVPRNWSVAEWWLVNFAVIAIVFLLSYLLERRMQPLFQAYTIYFRDAVAPSRAALTARERA
jgi:hypothetical protein